MYSKEKKKVEEDMLSNRNGEHLLGIITGITLLIFLLVSGSAGAVPAEEWNRTFGGANYEQAYSVQQTADGGYILAGYRSNGTASSDAWLIKVSGEPNGTAKAPGFEMVLAIAMLLTVYNIGRKRR